MEVQLPSPGIPSSTSGVVVSSFRSRHHYLQNQRLTIPELLASREVNGLNIPRNAYRRSKITCPNLSSTIPWNPSRLRNMILSVGPATPAAAVMTITNMSPDYSQSSSVASSSSASSNNSDQENVMDQGNFDRDPSSQATATATNLSSATRTNQDDYNHNGSQSSDGDNDGNNDKEDEDDDDDDDDDDEDSHHQERVEIDDPQMEQEEVAPGRVFDARIMNFYYDDESEDDFDEEDNRAARIEFLNRQQQLNSNRRLRAPSMRHGGCINTAAWLDCQWRLSTVGTTVEAAKSWECPTQCVTSGDDHLVKFWDVSHAMGMANPLAGGNCTICPFSSPPINQTQDEIRKTWRDYYKKRPDIAVAGGVIPLVTLHTGHRGNVFHVTPLKNKPGKVATCGADGFLRLTDLESNQSSVVVSPEYDDDIGGLLPIGLLSLRAGMCFSHHFLNNDIGLLCSERGLRLFDLRLPPREQPSQSLIGGPFRACKACAIWSSSTTTMDGSSAYVFAGGSSPDVALCDLRMTDGSSTRVVQRYCPSGLADCKASVSGLDLTKDKKELLVSYESDQVYTFPVFSEVSSAAGPTLDEINELCIEAEDSSTEKIRELAAYGGHLNRFTFLKNAKYAGPNDEYICTGSDSGHAWIYEKSTGVVASLLNADHSTCNGVVPHPTLPIFISYGIDSTAKLWRATTPVDPNVDDSATGRAKCFRDRSYEMSPTVRKWREVQKVLSIMNECKDSDILPDQIPNTKEIFQSNRHERALLRRESSDRNRISNDLRNLPDVLRHNLYACFRSFVDGEDKPVESDIDDLKHRISIMRLRHQADTQGLIWNAKKPWSISKPVIESQDPSSPSWYHPADLVPDFPSDWIPYDPDMSRSPWDNRNFFNLKDHAEFYKERYLHSQEESTNVVTLPDTPWLEWRSSNSSKDDGSWIDEVPERQGDISAAEYRKRFIPEDVDDVIAKYIYGVYRLLYETILLLKDGGNDALQKGFFNVAARRYDKAIQYGAIAFMSFPAIDLDLAKGREERLLDHGGYQAEWGPLLKVVIVSRLNMALLMLKPNFLHPEVAVEQARLALDELKPFCMVKGKIMRGTKLDAVFRDDEPETTFNEAMALQAKAYFRLGSAHYEMGDYSLAIHNFDHSVKCTQLSNAKPDNLVLRRLNDAKRENKRKNRRQRKKFKRAFGDGAHHSCKNASQDGLSDDDDN